jgi:multisubunit Na+/H+ antiporter MnhC subunit
MKQALSAMLLLPILGVAQEARYLSPGVLGRLKSAWVRLSKLRKTIVVGIAVAAVMISSSILNHGKPDATWSSFLTMVCTIVVLLMWGLYRLLRRSRILIALALSVALNGLGGLASLQHAGAPRWVLPFIVPVGFLTWLFRYIFSDADFGSWFGFWLGWLFSIAFYAAVAWTILTGLGSRKRSKSETRSKEQSMDLE